MAILGVILARSAVLAKLLLVTILGHLMIVAIKSADWDSRCLLHVLPLITVFAARGVVWSGESVMSHQMKHR
jgi:hypothetical protein